QNVPDWRAVRDLARTYSLGSVRSLAGLMENSQSEPARAMASVALLRFAWGRRATTGEEKHDADTSIVDFLTAPSPTADRRVASGPGEVLSGSAAGDAGAVAEP